MTSRCTGACGLMSRIATNPSVACDVVAVAVRAGKTGNRHAARPRIPSSVTALGPDTDELADRRVDEEGRVVVAVAAARAVDEHEVV